MSVVRRYNIPIPLGADPTKTGLAYASDRGNLYTYQDAVRGNWVPTLIAIPTPPTLGTGSTQIGDFVYHAGYCTCDFLIAFGSAGSAAGSGIYGMGGFPIPPDLTGPRAGGFPVGQAHLRNVGTSTFHWKCIMQTTGLVTFESEAGVQATNAVPFAWGGSDNIRGRVKYKVLD